MFSNARNNSEEQEAERLKDELTTFLDHSYEFKQMKKIARRSGKEDGSDHMSGWIRAIEGAKDLWKALYLTRDIDPKHTENIVIYNLGTTNVKVIGFFGSYVSDNVGFMHYLLRFRQSIEAHKKLDSTRGGWW